MTDYTPTTEEVEEAYRWISWDENFKSYVDSSKEFQRWLRTIKSDAFEEGARSWWGADDNATVETLNPYRKAES